MKTSYYSNLYLFVIIFLLISYISISEDYYKDHNIKELADKLEEKIQNNQFDSTFFDIADIVFYYYIQSDPSKGLKILQKLLSIPEYGYKDRKVVYLHYLSNFYKSINRQDLALKYLLESITLYERNNIMYEKYLNYSEIGNLYYSLELYEEAINYYFKSYQGLIIYETNKVRNEFIHHYFAVILSNIGLCYQNLKDYKNAIYFYSKAFNYSLPNNNLIRNKLQYYYLGDCYALMGNIDSSNYYLHKSLTYEYSIKERKTSEIEYLKFHSFAYIRLINNFIKLNIADSVNYYYNINYNYIKKHFSPYLQIKHLALLSEVFLDNNIDKALDLLNEAYKISIESNDSLQLDAIYKNLSKVYYNKNDFKKSYEYINKYIEISESRNKNKYLNFFEINKSAESLNQQINNLLITERLQKEYLHINKIIIIIISITLLIAIILLLLLIKKNREIKKLNNALSNKNEELNFLNKSLEESNNTKNLLFSIIAHDLKNAIGSSSNMISLISDHFDDFTNEELKDIFKELRISYESAVRLLQNLLIWSSILRGKITPNFEYANPFYIVQNSISLYNTKSSEKKIIIKNNIPENLRIKLDASMIDTLFRNLINNSLKFTNKNGEININYYEEENFHKFEVEDNGVGMSKETLEDISNKKAFPKLGTDGEKGTGLGLMICKEFVHLHNGDFWFESELGKGTKAIFTISKSV